MKPELFNPNLYKCWLTGYGAGQIYKEKIENQVNGYLERKAKKDEAQTKPKRV